VLKNLNPDKKIERHQTMPLTPKSLLVMDRKYQWKRRINESNSSSSLCLCNYCICSLNF